jgi:hypothetical protein
MTPGVRWGLTIAGRDVTPSADTSFRAQFGRDDADGQPSPGSATFRLRTRFSDPLRWIVPNLSLILTAAFGQAAPRTVWTGVLMDVERQLTWVTDPRTQRRSAIAEVTVNAVGPLARAARTLVGDAQWPQESDGARVHRVLAAAGAPLATDLDAGTVQVIARAPSNGPATDIAAATAASARGCVWETRHGTLTYRDRAARKRGGVPHVTLSANQLGVDLTTRRDGAAVINRIDWAYGPDDGTDRPRIHLDSPYSILAVGEYADQQETELATAQDAEDIGMWRLLTRRDPIETVDSITIALDDHLTGDLIEELLTQPPGALIELRDLPPVLVGTRVWRGFAEGVTITASSITMTLSDERHSVPALPWREVDPELDLSLIHISEPTRR